jgi:glycine cleavage system aminomethyltransferase T
MLGHGIALAFLEDPEVRAPGLAVGIEQRGRVLEGEIVETPFVRAGVWATSR